MPGSGYIEKILKFIDLRKVSTSISPVSGRLISDVLLSAALITTKSAGTGKNKPDVRLVFQLSWPKSVEEYFQQIERAGRDNRMSVYFVSTINK